MKVCKSESSRKGLVMQSTQDIPRGLDL